MAEGGRRANESDKPAHGFNRHWFVHKKIALEYQCGVCQQILQDPVQIVGCGDQCCKLCLPDKANKCPICHRDFKENEGFFHDVSVQKKVLALKIKCPTHRGCDWKGKLGDYLKEHTKDCKCELVNCINEGCNERIVKENLQTHAEKECKYRKVKCRHCSKDIIFANETTHLEKCPSIPLGCTQNCTKQIPRKEMKKHVQDECEMTMVDCPYKDVGCTSEIHRRDAKNHERDSMQEHLHFAIIAINNANTEKKRMGNEIGNLIEENGSLREELVKSSEAHEIHIVKIEDSMKNIEDEGSRRLEDVQKGVEQNFESASKLAEQNEAFKTALLMMYSEIDCINDSVIPQLVQGYKAHEGNIQKLFVEADRSHKLSVGITRHFDRALKEAKDEMETKMDQLAQQHEHDYEKTVECQEAVVKELDRINQAVMKNADDLNMQTQALLVFKDDTKDQLRNVSRQMERDYENLAEKISNEKQARQQSFQELTQEVARLKVTSISYGSFLWKIDNVESALKMAKLETNEALYGQSFYSRPDGYLMRPKLFLNGARQSDRAHISVFLQLLKSANDALLRWPFRQRVRFTLVEQQQQQQGGAQIRRDVQRDLVPNVDSEEVRRPSDEANNGYGIFKFIEHEVLLTGNYVVDGTMFVRVEVFAGDDDEPHSETI